MRSFFILISSLLAFSIQAQDSELNSPYAGEENRRIKSLSSEDIAQISAGNGWGLAKMAELNGYPGPGHVLEMAYELDLSDIQRTKIELVFKEMNTLAKEKGADFLKSEERVDEAFQTGEISKQLLEELVTESAQKYGELRLIHLQAHLTMMEILNKSQIKQYMELRGYNSSDPCASVPEGHNAEMWKKHNGCNR